MSPRTLFLSRLIGLYCIVAAFSMFLRRQEMVHTVTLLLQDGPLMYIVGVVTLGIGLAMVLTHNVWSGGVAAVIVTLIGWAALLKGALFMLLTPETETTNFLNRLHYAEFFEFYAAFSLAVGVYLTYCGFTGRSRT